MWSGKTGWERDETDIWQGKTVLNKYSVVENICTLYLASMAQITANLLFQAFYVQNFDIKPDHNTYVL